MGESDMFIRLIRNSDVWGMYKEADKDGGVAGRGFFHNKETGTSSWKPPRLSLQVELRRQKDKKKEEESQKKEEEEEEHEEEEEMTKREGQEKKKIVMRVGERRKRGKGSEILEPSSFSRNGSILREKNVTSVSLLRVPTSLKIRPRSHAFTSFDQLSPPSPTSPPPPSREDTMPLLRSRPPLPPPSKDMRRSLWARDWTLSFEDNQKAQD